MKSQQQIRNDRILIMCMMLIGIASLIFLIGITDAVSLEEIKRYQESGTNIFNTYNTMGGGYGGGQILYFHHDTVESPVGYEGLQITPAGQSEVDESITVVNTAGLKIIDPYITLSTYPATTVLSAGLWRFRTFHYVNSATGTTSIVFSVYNRTTTGTMTKLFDVKSEDINSLTPIEYLTPYVQQNDYKIANTDRLVINVSANTTHSANIITHFVYEGAIHTSHVQTPLPLSYTIPPMINESYAYLPGRTGNGQTFNKLVNFEGIKNITDPYIIDNRDGLINIINTDNSSDNYPIGLNIVSLGSPNAYGFRVDSDYIGISNLMDSPLATYSYGINSEIYNCDGIHNCYAFYGDVEGTSLNKFGFIMYADFNQFNGVLQNFGSEYFDDLGTGTVYSSGGFLTTTSDEKIKTNITPYTSNTTKLKNVIPIQYYFSKESGLKTDEQITGFSAQNLLSSIPEAVSVKNDLTKTHKRDSNGKIIESFIPVLNPDGTQSETYSISDRAIIAVLVNSVKEQQTKIEKQDIEIAILKAKVDKLVKP